MRINRSVILFLALAWCRLALGGEIHDAAMKGDLETVRALLQAHPKLVSSTDWSPATKAVTDKFNDAMEAVWDEFNSDYNIKSGTGQTPLFYAVVSNHLDVAELLLAHAAEENSFKDVAEILRQHGGKD